MYVQPIGIPFNITPKFQVGAIFPFKFVTPKGGETAGGLSDITLFTKYQLYKKDEVAKTFRILASLKQTFPTGNSVSSGIYQTYVGLIIGKISTAIGLYSDFGYTITSGNATDNFLYNFAVSIPLLPQKYPQKQLNTLLELNGSYMLDQELHTLFIAPGLQFIPGRRILFETSVQLPIIQDSSISNKTNYMLLVGTRFLIN
ncbi:MAG: hypothetical protein JKY69_00905 [Flavobacteriaceae bacterium]|nr:hypothetical protein [Flavobacteriaceae bacterium]